MPKKKFEDENKIKAFIHCFSMPSKFNSNETKNIARDLCKDLNVTFDEISIEEAFERELEVTRKMLGGEPDKLTIQNIQARIRGMRMWNFSNAKKALFIQTGNMSEKAVGYTTIGGDLMGGYSLIGNLPKTVCVELLKYISEQYNFPSLKELLKTIPSAELSYNQEDEKDLMPYEILDACFYLFAGQKMMPKTLYETLKTMWPETVLKEKYDYYREGMLKTWVQKFLDLFIYSIYKWVQAPLSVHLGSLDLDRERALQLPVVQSKEWLDWTE